MSDRFDVVIVGGGPAGLAAGAQAARRGLSHVVLERGELANTVHRYQKGKFVMAEPDRLPLHEELPIGFQAGSREQVLEGWARDMERSGANLRLGPAYEVRAIEGQRGDFLLTLAGGSRVSGGAVVLAIGVQGNIRRFGVPGDDQPFVTHQLDDPGEHKGRRIVVVGAGDTGIENALALVDHDNEVSLLNRREEFDRAKAANRTQVEAAIRGGRLAYYPNSRVMGFEPGRLLLRADDGNEVALDVDLVIGRLGATPPRAFLEGMGVAFPSEDPRSVPQVSPSYESNVPGVHLIGALAGYPLIKNCINQGYEVIEHILGQPVVPADEPLLREKFACLDGSVSEILERIRATLPLFHPLTTIQLRELLVDAEVHRPAAAEILYERNDFSDSLYAILSGSVEGVFPADEAPDGDGPPGGAPERRVYMRQSDFFGEGSLISGRRRSGTIVAGEDCVVIEVPRYSMTRTIHSVPEVRRVVDAAFVSRHLNSLVPDAPPDELRTLAGQAVIETYEKGEVLFREGDESDGLHIVRRGAVTISKTRAGREMVIEYVQAGNYVGEMALLAPDRTRSATVRASVATETIRLPNESIGPFLECHPELRERLEAMQIDRTVNNARTVEAAETDLVEFLMDAGVGEATDMLLVDEALCIRCDNCETACASTHGGVTRLDREAGPSIGTVHIPTACRHCENPKCMTDCPPDVIRRHGNGEVFIMEGCIGCGNCAAHCPYDVIQMEVARDRGRPNLLLQLLFGWRGGKSPEDAAAAGHGKLAVKCDLCRNLPQPETGPRRAACVDACPTGAIVRIDPRGYVDQVLGSED